jgi:hypothetical protein
MKQSLALVAVLLLTACMRMTVPQNGVVIRVDSVSGTRVDGHVLSKITESVYKATSTSTTLDAPNDIRISMGSRSDVKPGAILYVEKDKIVVLTPMITVR